MLKSRGDGDLKHRYRPQRLDELAPTAALTRLQRMAKDPKSQVYLFEGPSGTGKCLGLGTPVIMGDGTVKSVELIQTGDKLMGPDGNIRTVLSTTAGRGPLFRIDPIKGEPWVCNDVHVMTLVHSGRNDIIDVPLNDYIGSSRNFKNYHKLFSVGVESFFGAPFSPSVDPYFLGVWFGDGGKDLIESADGDRRVANITIWKSDPEIRQLCADVANQWGLAANNVTKKFADRCPGYQITAGSQTGGQDNPLLTAVRELVGPGVDVPGCVSRGSRKTRLDFLAGFLDADAELADNCFIITQKREDWARAIWWIARSLNFCATIKPRKARDQNGTEGTYFVVTISGDTDGIPTRIPGKKAAPQRQMEVATRTGFAVSPIGEGNYYGFTLDGDGRFLLGDFTVTHNTTCARIIARASVCEAKDGKPCLKCTACSTLEQSGDFIELNIADLRKIDDIREIIEGMRFMPMQLKRKIYIFDECFPAKTNVRTSSGEKHIECVRPGDRVETLSGISTVRATFINRVDLRRVCRLDLSLGAPVFTTLQHQFLTNRGWVEAQKLQKDDFVFRFRGHLMDHDNLNSVRVLQDNLRAKISVQSTEVLLQELRTEASEPDTRTRSVRDEESGTRSDGRGQNTSHKGEERHISRAAWEPWRKRKTHSRASKLVEGSWRGVEAGASDISRKETIWLPDLLQGGFGSSDHQAGHRDRWTWSQLEKDFIARPEEDGRFARVGVEGIEVYEPGHNDEAFSSIISDQDRCAGHVSFYDLEIQGHPSYLADGVIAHNCHQLTPDAQQVLLKTFEEPPSGLLIFMCTTNTKGLDKTLLDRAEKVSFKPLSDEVANEIVAQVMKDAGKTVSQQDVAKLIAHCDGSARALLNNAQAFLDGGFDPETAVEDESGPDVKDLATALLDANWAKTAEVLKRPSIKSKPEGTRIGVENYLRAVLLGSSSINTRAVAALTTIVGTVSTEPGISQYNRFVFKCVKACQNKT